MNYYEIRINCPQAYRDLLIYQLNQFQDASFWEHEDGFSAFFSRSDFKKHQLFNVLNSYSDIDSDITFSINEVPEINWNKEWESNYPPVIINDRLLIRAPFHPENNELESITINPQMAFGTGHHATTSMMVQLQHENDFIGKKVLDYGTGTGILSILAEQLGAIDVLGIDNDEIAINSALENIQSNDCSCVRLMVGDLNNLDEPDFDIILANINKNTIINAAPLLDKFLKKGGIIITSGYFSTEIEEISSTFKGLKIEIKNQLTKNEWAACIYKK